AATRSARRRPCRWPSRKTSDHVSRRRQRAMSRLIAIDGSVGEGGGQILRTALALSTVTGQGFTITRIRAGRLRPGLRPQHLAAVRAAAFISNARVGGAFEGSPDLRFEPEAVTPGEFRFEIGTAGA